MPAMHRWKPEPDSTGGNGHPDTTRALWRSSEVNPSVTLPARETRMVRAACAARGVLRFFEMRVCRRFAAMAAVQIRDRSYVRDAASVEKARRTRADSTVASSAPTRSIRGSLSAESIHAA